MDDTTDGPREAEKMQAERAMKARALRDTPGVWPRMGAVQHGLRNLQDTLDQMQEKLAPVLMPDRPTPTLAHGEPSPEPSSELAGQLAEMAEHADRLALRLAALLARVDL
jgi:hypothetical protein